MEKNNTDVIIDDKVYTISTDQDASYVRQLAAYINEKIEALRNRRGYGRQPYGIRHMILLMNLADDYYKMKQQAEEARHSYEQQEAEFYNMKREMVNMQLEMERMRDKMQAGQVLSPALCPYLKSLEHEDAKCAVKEETGRHDDHQEKTAPVNTQEAAPSGRHRPPYEVFLKDSSRKVPMS